MSATEFKDKFQRFIRTFKDTEAAEDEINDDFNAAEPLYLQKLTEVGFCIFCYFLVSVNN